MKPSQSLKDKFASFAVGLEGFTAHTMALSLASCAVAVTAGGLSHAPYAAQMAISAVCGGGASFFAAFGVGMSGRFFRGDAPVTLHKSYERMGRVASVALPIIAGIGVAVGLNNAFTPHAQDDDVSIVHVACEKGDAPSPHTSCLKGVSLSL